MGTWSSYSESFYRSLLEGDLKRAPGKRPDRNLLKNIIDSSSSNISVNRSPPKSGGDYGDHLFAFSDSINDGRDLAQKTDLLQSKVNLAKVIHKSQGTHTVRKINYFQSSSGWKLRTIHSIPYEKSHYVNINLSKYGHKAISKTSLFTVLEREIINCMESVYLYDEKQMCDYKHVVVKPSGVLNAGIMGMELIPRPSRPEMELEVREAFTIYPSCFFCYRESDSGYFMSPYKPAKENERIETSWDGYTVRSRLYGEGMNLSTINDMMDILEIRTDNKSIFSTTVYARNALGIFVFKYLFEDEWKVKPINSVCYKPNEKVYYMSVSPYLPDEALFLTTGNELMVYDGNLGHERQMVDLSLIMPESEDIIQTVCHGMDNNNLVLGGNKLYLLDKRAPTISPLMLPLQSSITVTSTNWTERKFDFDYPSRHYRSLLSGRYCSLSSYWRTSTPSFWKCFTACEIHPKLNYILAAVCGTSNSVFIIDMRIPTSPVLDIPLSSSEFIGSRFRYLRWECDGAESLLLVFSWRQKFPICIRLQINAAFTAYSFVNKEEYSQADFAHCDPKYDTMITFDRTNFVNFLNVDEEQEEADFPSCGPLIESQKDYTNHIFHLTRESSLTNIFHGFLGMALVQFRKSRMKLLLAFTTSGRLLCQSLNNRSFKLVRESIRYKRGRCDIDLEHEADSFSGFIIRRNNSSGIPFPPELTFDGKCKHFNPKKSEINVKYDEFMALGVSESFVKIQEQHFGDERTSAAISINPLYLKECNIESFDSKAIFDGLLAFDKGGDYHKGSIMCLAKFVKLYGEEALEGHQVWNPFNSRLDYEYERDFKNPFVKNPEFCACFALKNDTFDTYRRMLSQVMEVVEKDADPDPREEDSGASTSFQEEVPEDRVDSIYQTLIDKVERKESLVMDKSVAKAFGDMVVLQSNLGKEAESDEAKGEATHRDDCPLNQFVSVQLSSDREEFEPPQIVDEILSSWVIDQRPQQKEDLGPPTRSFDPGDMVENLRDLRRRQQDLVAKILANMDSKV